MSHRRSIWEAAMALLNFKKKAAEAKQVGATEPAGHKDTYNNNPLMAVEC